MFIGGIPLFKKIAAGVLSLMLVLSGTVFQVPAYAEPQTDGVEISESTFPDTAFRKYVTENFDTDQNLILSQDEINKATNIFIRMKGVQTLKAVSYTHLDVYKRQAETIPVERINTAVRGIIDDTEKCGMAEYLYLEKLLQFIL